MGYNLPAQIKLFFFFAQGKKEKVKTFLKILSAHEDTKVIPFNPKY